MYIYVESSSSSSSSSSFFRKVFVLQFYSRAVDASTSPLLSVFLGILKQG